MVRGVPKIANVELADREWTATTRPRVDHPPPLPPTAALDAAAAAAELPLDVPDYNVSRARREAAAARREAALADIAEIEASEKKGELVPTAEAREYVIGKFAVVKTKILGVPTRVAQRLPHLASEVVPAVEELLREALEELAAEDDAGDGEGEEAAA
jgi:phage terminase Nu1 subunit (DNA packaging protein)